ncbi:ferredoxin [Candidatus Thiodiazotropha endoloripes]|uniref:(Fe-S)-binding protein n=1 Tax=Candidatus Thiodiazotropha endoloripes TaxID=1818881 RepID=UPI00083D7334|nr:(Fe-S)-binding protein [Candidatus Thiodiazotropha endoloripes]ODB94991.1 ferredoxin [Candidatus Thiodiazotropha endoloripes]
MKTYLDWSEYRDAGMGDAYADIPKIGGDFAKAVAVCINSRRCESLAKGVMCPSFRLDANPGLSTGARVRLLKAALNGELGSGGLLSPELVEALDLCVSCKGCQRECENNVDMSRIKIEYLAQLNASKGLSLRARLFSDLPELLAKRHWLIKLIAIRNRHPWIATLAERLLGISGKLSLPEPVDLTRKYNLREIEDGQPVVLFADTFCKHFSPDILAAAVEVLQATGCQVSLIGAADEEAGYCCGRTYLSQGRIDEARQQAGELLQMLTPYAQKGVPIIGLEPSCLLTLRDEYRALGLGEVADLVAGKAVLFEEFLAKGIKGGKLNLSWSEQAIAEQSPVLVHGHCHQKAVGAMKSMRKVLKQIPGLSFEMIDASCCGMAGSFGLEAEHYETAKAMAQQALLPALESRPEALILANGFSCRHQIEVQAGRPALHLAQLIRLLMV